MHRNADRLGLMRAVRDRSRAHSRPRPGGTAVLPLDDHSSPVQRGYAWRWPGRALRSGVAPEASQVKQHPQGGLE